MVEVVCDTSFLMVLASTPLKGIEELEAEMGKIHFVVPSIVIRELKRLASAKGVKRAKEAALALELASGFKIVEVEGVVADDAIMEYVSKRQCMVATIDNALKSKLRKSGIRIITLSNNKLIIV